jgi:hypothetical protein
MSQKSVIIKLFNYIMCMFGDHRNNIKWFMKETCETVSNFHKMRLRHRFDLYVLLNFRIFGHNL